MHTYAQTGAPSRPPVKACVWEKRADAAIGLGVWVQRCDFGFRKIELALKPGALTIKYSDGGAAEPVIDIIDLLAGETAEAGMKRIFTAHTAAAAFRARCELVPYRSNVKAPQGAQRFSFVPNAAYRKELTAHANPDEVGEPACGPMGEMPDGIQYFQVASNSTARKILFVRIGQDEPLFDENTLQLLDVPAAAADKAEVRSEVQPQCCEFRPGKQGISADFLLETCSVTGQTAHGMIPYFDCQSYILATLDSYKTLNAIDPAQRQLCLPAEMTAKTVLQTMESFYSYERDGQRRATDIIFSALQKRFACNKS